MSSAYDLIYTDKALKQLKKLDRTTNKYIIKYIEKNIKGSDNPRLYGKALTGDKSGLWRYRIGDYRLICKIEDEKLLVLSISIGHRREVYNKNL